MAQTPRYSVGDTIVLKGGFAPREQAGRTGTVSAVLPSDGNHAQYRVRIAAENFDRRVVESDIDEAQSTASSVARSALAAEPRATSWLKTSSIRVRK